MTDYVLGFAFNESMKQVVLVKKNRPDWQAGKYNGIGGKIEEGECATDAMVREFKEETNVYIKHVEWKDFGYIYGLHNKESFRIWCFRTVTNDVLQVETTTDEEIFVMPVSDALRLTLVPNAAIMLTTALSDEFDNINLILRYNLNG